MGRRMKLAYSEGAAISIFWNGSCKYRECGQTSLLAESWFVYKH